MEGNTLMPPLRIGILGFGFIGKVHAYAYHNMGLYYDPPPIETKLAGVCTAHEETAEKARAKLGFDFATTDWRTITENPQIDVVNICTPNNAHLAQILSCIEQGKHVYCDKPLVTNADEARQVLKALEGYEGVHQMTFNYRFLPATLRARQLVDEGFLGDPLCFRAGYLHAGSVDPEAPLKWKLTAKAGGGVIQDLGSHVVDLMRWLVGEFSAVSCATKIAYPERPVAGKPVQLASVDAEDHAVMTVRTENGALGTIEASKIATGAEDELRFEIHGTRGGMRFNLMEPNWLEVYDQTAPDAPHGGERGWKRLSTVNRYDPPSVMPPPKSTGGWLRAHAACLHNFLNAIATGSRAEPGLDTGAQVQFTTSAAHEAAATDGWVDIAR